MTSNFFSNKCDYFVSKNKSILMGFELIKLSQSETVNVNVLRKFCIIDQSVFRDILENF